MSATDEDKIIDDFMGDNGRAAEWTALRESLQDRLRALRVERATSTLPNAISSLDKRIAQIADQVAALETEEVISQFVEDSVRASLRGSVRRFATDDDDI
jgi:hypothetical protein